MALLFLLFKSFKETDKHLFKWNEGGGERQLLLLQHIILLNQAFLFEQFSALQWNLPSFSLEVCKMLQITVQEEKSIYGQEIIQELRKRPCHCLISKLHCSHVPLFWCRRNVLIDGQTRKSLETYLTCTNSNTQE